MKLPREGEPHVWHVKVLDRFRCARLRARLCLASQGGFELHVPLQGPILRAGILHLLVDIGGTAPGVLRHGAKQHVLEFHRSALPRRRAAGPELITRSLVR